MIKNIKELNLNWWLVPDHPYRILIFGGYFLVYSSTVLLQNMCVQTSKTLFYYEILVFKASGGYFLIY